MSDSVTDPNIGRDEHDDTGGVKAKRVKAYVWNPSTLEWEKDQAEAALATRIDDSNDPITYVGKAPIGSATSSAVWQVAKLDTTSGLVKTWADGNASYDNIWDNRASLSYQ